MENTDKESDPRRENRKHEMRDFSRSGRAGKGAMRTGDKDAMNATSGLEETTEPGRQSKHAGERNMATDARGAREGEP